jgi:nucleoside-diphosphate-sugar epimerase
MQVILGAGGAIGNPLANFLSAYTNDLVLASRNPKKVNPNDILKPTDLLNPDDVLAAVKGAEVAYLTAGLPYKASLWERQWPVVMQNTIAACISEGCKLVFFDNIYMYDPDLQNPMTEEHPRGPLSRKGKVRRKLEQMLEKAGKEHGLQYLIARSADFYGPGLKNNSVLTETVLKPLSTGKRANWLGNPECKHSFTYIPDAAKATALLGNTPDAFGEVWHLPTSKEPPTGHEWISMSAKLMTKPAKFQPVSKTMLSVLGIFVPVMRELKEMYYQSDRDYVFDSSKFDKRFSFETTTYEHGLRETIESTFK